MIKSIKLNKIKKHNGINIIDAFCFKLKACVKFGYIEIFVRNLVILMEMLVIIVKYWFNIYFNLLI